MNQTYDPERATSIGLPPIPELAPLETKTGDDVECVVHGISHTAASTPSAVVTTLGRKEICRPCLFDLIRDGRLAVVPTNLYIEHLSGANVIDTSVELNPDGSASAGGVAFAWS